MRCLRCGKCCYHLSIFVINPASILLDGTVDPNDGGAMIFKPARKSCPHLSIESHQAICIIHHLPCYQGTPCEQMEQIGPKDAVCIMSGYFRIREETCL
ncbi:Uncharacterised protein [uncultured archaeon]|nr:Uncharacterised protein [uncultured archaeon]